ncbi:MAG TPA: ABC transporter substrate-binding protein, partial [Oligoflexia bacterium]|nr:ABC transporter substrate-binding protein [Oligoflexia bacterium]
MLDRTFQLGRTVVALLLLGLLLAFAACQKTAQDQIRIGAILPLSGAGAGIGSALKSGLELGVREINARGGVNGRQLSIIYEDTQSEPRNSVAAFKKLVELEG